MIFKEKTLSSQRIYEGTILNLRKDKVTVRNGQSSREIVEHNGGAAVVAIDHMGRVILVEQFRKTFEQVMLELPAGKIDKGEDYIETARRELREETGYEAKNIRHINTMYPSVGYSQEKIYIYLAWDLTKGNTDFDENEAIDLVAIEFDQVYEMVMSGIIKDAKTIIGILLAKKHLTQIDKQIVESGLNNMEESNHGNQ